MAQPKKEVDSQVVLEKIKQLNEFQQLLFENENGEPLTTIRQTIVYNVLKTKFLHQIRLLELEVYDLCHEEDDGKTEDRD